MQTPHPGNIDDFQTLRLVFPAVLLSLIIIGSIMNHCRDCKALGLGFSDFYLSPEIVSHQGYENVGVAGTPIQSAMDCE